MVRESGKRQRGFEVVSTCLPIRDLLLPKPVSGICIQGGDGVPQDFEEALKWYQLAADQGVARAQFNLGVMYSNGEGSPRKRQRGLEVVPTCLPIRESPGLSFNRGVMYSNGEGIPENDREAVKWFRLAAEQGFSDAQLNLGVMYSNGEGVPENGQRGLEVVPTCCRSGSRQGSVQSGVSCIPTVRESPKTTKRP